MNYCGWNRKLGDHFFGERSRGKRIFMCVTRETLAEVSGLSHEEALTDFVGAVCEGPDWTRIRGCTLIETKVHCCLHVDPRWGQHWSDEETNPQGVRELQDLSTHIHWAEYQMTKPRGDEGDSGNGEESGTGGYPPYLGYLAAFVLAWTERDSDYNGHDYYDPLLDLLDRGRTRWTSKPAFNRPYSFKGKALKMNDVWRDLMRFCEAYDRGELVLPDSVLRDGHYVGAPMFLGLMKASDLRGLEGLFAAMEESKDLDPSCVPLAKAFVSRVVGSRHAGSFLSARCLEDLGKACKDEDKSMAEAYGRLLQGKYRDFDGLPDEGEQAQGGRRRRGARLLRVLDRNGRIRVVCRLRSEAALRKLALEEDADYVFTGEGFEASTRWIAPFEWFNPMDAPGHDPMGALDLECAALRIKAAMPAKDFVVLHNPGLYFLAGCRVEVDEVERGRQYVMLAKGTGEPGLGGIKLTKLNTPCSQGLSCWAFSVPGDATEDGWPDELPPLAEATSTKPRLSFSGFRLASRAARFPVGLPVRIRCSQDNVELQARGIEGLRLKAEDEGEWVLEASQPGEVALSLLSRETQLAPEGWQDQRIQIESLDAGENAPVEFPMKLIGDTGAPPYPEALVELVGGARDPRGGDGNACETYFATAAPKVKVVARTPKGTEGWKVLSNGKPCTRAQGGLYDLPSVEVGKTQVIEVKDDDTLLRSLKLGFSREPELRVKCASANRGKPVEVAVSLAATVSGDAGLVFDWEVRDGEVHMAGGQAMVAPSSVWRGVLMSRADAVIQPGKTYEVRFGFSGRFTVSQWFRFKGVRQQGGTANPLRRGGFNSLENAFKGLQFPDSEEGGAR